MVSDAVLQALPAIISAVTGLLSLVVCVYIALKTLKTHGAIQEAVQLIRALRSSSGFDDFEDGRRL